MSVCRSPSLEMGENVYVPGVGDGKNPFGGGGGGLGSVYSPYGATQTRARHVSLDQMHAAWNLFHTDPAYKAARRILYVVGFLYAYLSREKRKHRCSRLFDGDGMQFRWGSEKRDTDPEFAEHVRPAVPAFSLYYKYNNTGPHLLDDLYTPSTRQSAMFRVLSSRVPYHGQPQVAHPACTTVSSVPCRNHL